MFATATSEMLQTLRIEKEIFIAAPLDLAFEAILEELGPASEKLGGVPMPMVLEPWPGGRWYRDLGNQSGHLWGHVQVIKPPTLIELSGPLFMSYACMNHVQYRLTAEGTGTKLQFLHRGVGEITGELREGVHQGWGYKLDRVRQFAESRLAKK